MRVLVFSLLLILCCPEAIFAQNSYKYWVGFADKNNTNYSVNQPDAYLSKRSIDRRQKHNIQTSMQDFPVNPWYVDSLVDLGLWVHYTSRWFNGAMISSADSLLVQSLAQKSYVREVIDVNFPSGSVRKRGGAQQEEWKEDDAEIFRRRRTSNPESLYGKATEQVLQLGVEQLHSRGFMGQGILIAVLDAGFRSVDTMAAFRHLWLENRVLMTRDFVGNTVFNSSTHGTGVLSTMAGSISGQFLGTAPKAKYMLCRTEDAGSEFPVEEYNWIAAAELADSAGADVLNSSLGYYSFDNPKYDYTYQEMDGNTSVIARAAAIAASKGILVVSSAGNSGNQPWKYISTPADADSILTVGAVNSDGKYAPFSSVGPSSDKRIKPDVAAHGWMTYSITPSGSVLQGNGTSYASPVLAGAAACLMQSVPAASSWQARRAIIESGNQYLSPDSLLGYGIPNFPLAYLLLDGGNIQSIDKDNDFSVMPNPFESYLEIAYHSKYDGTYSMQLVSSSGRRVLSLTNQQQVKGYNYLRIDSLQHLKKGVYILELTCNKRIFSRKVVKV